MFDNLNQTIEAYDPFDFGSSNIELQARMVTENEVYLEQSLLFLVNSYLKPKFEGIYEGIILEPTMMVYTPPEIPSQVNDSDCGVFLLQFAKHIVQNKKIDFSSEHLLHFREEMKLELFVKRLSPIQYFEKNKEKTNEKKSSKHVKAVEIKQRRFDNKSLEDCWMNSTLQMILTGLDHLEECADNGSTLWNTLICLKNESKQKALNPLPVKKILISKENERVQAQQLISNLRLHAGQQDAIDFFVCLKQNQIHWPDVFNTFKVRMKSIAECRSCRHTSSQANSEDFMFLEFSCPDSGMTMSTYLTEKMENPEVISEWRDEEGCGQRRGALLFNKIESIDNADFLIIMLRRLVDNGNGPTIIRNSVPLGLEARVSDLQNKSALFRPLAVIFHIGDVEGKETYGHYKADVRNLDGNWYRTSDQMKPQKIQESEVSDQGYIYLYQKIR